MNVYLSVALESCVKRVHVEEVWIIDFIIAGCGVF